MALNLKRKIWRVKEMVRKEGVLPAMRAVVRRLRQGPGHYVDVFRHYDFAMPYMLSAIPGEVRAGTILWFIPDFNLGSGGHLNIFRTIWHLERMGYTSTVVIGRPVMHQNADEAREEIRQHFFPLQARVLLGLDALPPSEFAVATGWDTAYAVRAFTGARHKLYFVQDYEPYFYPVGSESVLAENTYRFGFFGITAGDWLASKLAQEYGMSTHAVGFGVELDRYRRLPRREPEIRRVFFYARPPTPRRAFEIGLLVLNAVWKRLPDVQFVLAGWDTAGYHIPFPHLACGTVALDDLPDLYSQCDAALVLSLTNASLLPLELMASGCAVVSNHGANVEWLLNDDVVVLAESSPEKLADAVCTLLQDNEWRHALSQRAEAFARSQTWEAVARDFEAGLKLARTQNPQGGF
ncbi:MAG: glycosyltransferase family 4 protein [Acidovorax sp.]|uniref:glycosyltransferase family 4 protein n=1 Tax=Acidovorax sp. TaxID=1872122 RepID=UPI0022CA344A|nr:glycosyltransferase family 4 protein [Acidovorax sp.]MCZ8222271.1 glycosyltransferase family 4 protein [Acidovorax sp.]